MTTASVLHRSSPVPAAVGDLPTEPEMFRQIVVTVEAAWQNRLNKPKVEQWLSNFKGEVFPIEYERQMALWLLCNFVYYNQNEVRHLCRTAYREFLHSMFTRFPHKNGLGLGEEANRLLNNTRFYHSGRPGESGGFVLYFFRQENRLGVENFLTQPDKLPANVDTIVFVDDVVLSGEQAEPYLKRATSDYDRDKTKILLTFFTTDKAEDILRKHDITVISCTKLDERCRCFSSDSNVFVNHPTHRENCKTLAEHYGSKLKPGHPLGHGDGQYTFGFYYNTPDNTLPLFWSELGGWVPIMKRYDKIYGKAGLNELGRFV
jgi:hypothetical protein